MRTETRPWGRFEVLYEDDNTWLKRLIITPGQSLSLQYHQNRVEYWHIVDAVEVTVGTFTYPAVPGEIVIVDRGRPHRIKNTGQADATVLEWATGSVDESDIVRLDDDYGR